MMKIRRLKLPRSSVPLIAKKSKGSPNLQKIIYVLKKKGDDKRSA